MGNALDLLRSPKIPGIKPIAIAFRTRIHVFYSKKGRKREKEKNRKRRRVLEVRLSCRKLCS
jgi:hypothetical protein